MSSSPSIIAPIASVSRRGLTDVRQAAQAIFGLIHDLTGLRICVLTRVDFATNTLTVLDASDRSGLGITAGMTLPANEMPCDCVAR